MIPKSLPLSLPISLPKSLAVGRGKPSNTLVLSGTLPDGVQGNAYSAALAIIGGTAPYSNPLVISGALPAELSIAIVGSQLRVTGTPMTSLGVYSGTLQVQDSLGALATDPFSFTIHATGFIITESGTPITTESGSYLVTE